MKKHEIEVLKLKEFDGTSFILKCPICGKVTASASQSKYLPHETYCNGLEPQLFKSKLS